MTLTYKNKLATSIGTSNVTVYTVTTGATSTVLSLSVANTTVNPINVSVMVYSSTQSLTASLIKNAPVAAGSSLIGIGNDQKVILQSGDQIIVISSVASSCDAVLSCVETS